MIVSPLLFSNSNVFGDFTISPADWGFNWLRPDPTFIYSNNIWNAGGKKLESIIKLTDYMHPHQLLFNFLLQSWKLGFGASFLKVNSFPPLVQWLIRLKVSTLNKFTLYFQHSLQLQTNSLDFRALCNKHGIDYFQR